MHKYTLGVLASIAVLLTLIGVVAYYGLAPSSINYSFVWAIVYTAIILATILAYYELIKAKHSSHKLRSNIGRISLLLTGFILSIAAIPTAIMSEISINGCCGAPSTGLEGLGYAIGSVVFLFGLVLIFKNFRSDKS